MKKIINNLGCVIALTVGTTTVSFAGVGAHGGDGLVFEFTGTAKNISDKLISLGKLPHCPAPEIFAKVTTTDLNVPEHTSVTSQQIVLVNLIEQDASNDPVSHAIVLNRARLTALNDKLAYVNLVMHEYFGILGLETTNDNSKSLACIQDLNRSGTSNEQLAKLVFKISPISSFEQQFSVGKAGLSCSDGVHRFRLNLVGPQPQLNSVFGNLEFSIQADDTSWMKYVEMTMYSSEIISGFGSAYSVGTGETTFTGSFLSNYGQSFNLSSFDHVNWDLTVNFNHINGNGIFKYKQCTPLYFQD